MNKSESIASLATALASAQSEIENASKDSVNPHFKSKYADLAEVLNTIRPVFSRHGLSVTQFPSYEAGVVSVETILMHKSGEWLSGSASSRLSKDDAQGVGSCITYLRRYSLAAVAGIAQEDDDGQAAAMPANRQQSRTAAPVTKTKLSPSRLADAIAAIKEGRQTITFFIETFDLTKEQLLALEDVSC